MKIGITTGFGGATPPEFIATLARSVEERGLHSLWVPEHVLFFPEYASRYPYSADGKIPGNPTGVMEPFSALAYAAAHTRRIRLGTGICLVPQRSPVYTAKQVADVDFLSGGRVDFGVGVGWLREEFDALGVPWARRGARTRECLGVMRSLWCDEVSSFSGEFFTLPACLQNPKPVQKPHPPIFFGGESAAALRRVAELGQGWFGFGLSPERLTHCLEMLAKALSEAGRTRGELAIHVSPEVRPGGPDDARRFADLGVDQLILPFFVRSADEIPRRLDAVAKLASG